MATETILNKFADDVPVTLRELADAMRTSRWTVWRWKKQGYKFQFGNLTTAGHCKAWLELQAGKSKVVVLSDEDAQRLAAELDRLK